MKRFSLELLYQIVGIGSASGIFYKADTVFIVSDSGGYLYAYDTKTRLLDQTALIEGDVLENIPKRIKPDFEAIAECEGKLSIFGSGSTEARNRMVEFDPLKKQVAATLNLTPLYLEMQRESQISADDFNLEGAVYRNQNWYFFQRGNGLCGKNGVFTVKGRLDGNRWGVSFLEIALPEIGGVPVSFTDAVLVGDSVWFLATAEDTKSTYDDGEVVGSLVGKMDLETMAVTYWEQITDTQKFEGIAFHSQTNDEISFLLCEDNDSNYLESDVFRLVVGKQ